MPPPHPKEWLIRKAKRHYIGPCDTETIQKLILESELRPYDEIARSHQPWTYLKDCPPFSKFIEELIPHVGEEKTINLSREDITSVTQPGVSRPLGNKKFPPPKSFPKPVIDLEKIEVSQTRESPTQPKGHRPEGRRLKVIYASRTKLSWFLGAGAFLVLSLALLLNIFYRKEMSPPPLVSLPTEEAEELPEGWVGDSSKLKTLSDALQKSNVLFYQGKLEESAGQNSKAVELYQKAQELNPKDIKVKIRLAAIRLQSQESKDISLVRTEFLTLISSPHLSKTQKAEIENYLGMIELKGEKFINARPHFEAARQHDETFAPAYFNLGYCYFFEKQYYAAREHFDRALKLQPNMPLIYLYLGRTLQKLGKHEEAAREYSNANRINPNLHLPYLYLSFLYFKLNQKKQAFSFLEKMIKRDPEYDSHSYKDQRYMQESLSYRFIIQTYSFILKEKGTPSPALSSTMVAGLGLLHYLDGEINPGKRLVQKAIELNSQDSTAHTILAYMLQKEQDLEGALRELKTSLRYQYENSFTHVLMADIYIRLGHYQEAIEHCRKVFSFDPFYVRGYHMLGIALIELERVSEGIEAFNKALEYDPQYMPAKQMLLQYSK